jgi:hypothetical protein
MMVPNSSSWRTLLLLGSLLLLLSTAVAQDPTAPTDTTAGSVPATPTDTSPDIPSSAGNSNTSNSPPPLEAAPDNLTPKTTKSVQMAQQQQQQQDNSSDTGPAVDATQGVQEVCEYLCCVFGLPAFCAHSTKMRTRLKAAPRPLLSAIASCVQLFAMHYAWYPISSCLCGAALGRLHSVRTAPNTPGNHRPLVILIWSAVWFCTLWRKVCAASNRTWFGLHLAQ